MRLNELYKTLYLVFVNEKSQESGGVPSLYTLEISIFHVPPFHVLSKRKRERFGPAHVVEQVILYKTLYRAFPGNSVFVNLFLSQDHTCNLGGIACKWNNHIGKCGSTSNIL